MTQFLQDEPVVDLVHNAMDDLVPGDCGSGIYGDCRHMPHELECVVQRALLSMPRVHFSSLQVHRMEDGVCLTGIVNIPDQGDRPNFERIAGTAAGVTQVLNRLVIQRGSPSH